MQKSKNYEYIYKYNDSIKMDREKRIQLAESLPWESIMQQPKILF